MDLACDLLQQWNGEEILPDSCIFIIVIRKIYLGECAGPKNDNRNRKQSP